MAFLARSMQDFLGGDGGISSVPWCLRSACHVSFALRNPKLQVGEGGGLGPLRLFGCFAREAIGTFVAWYADVNLDPL